MCHICRMGVKSSCECECVWVCAHVVSLPNFTSIAICQLRRGCNSKVCEHVHVCRHSRRLVKDLSPLHTNTNALCRACHVQRSPFPGLTSETITRQIPKGCRIVCVSFCCPSVEVLYLCYDTLDHVELMREPSVLSKTSANEWTVTVVHFQPLYPQATTQSLSFANKLAGQARNYLIRWDFRLPRKGFIIITKAGKLNYIDLQTSYHTVLVFYE